MDSRRKGFLGDWKKNWHWVAGIFVLPCFTGLYLDEGCLDMILGGLDLVSGFDRA